MVYDRPQAIGPSPARPIARHSASSYRMDPSPIGISMAPSPLASTAHQYIETAAQLDQFVQDNQAITWLGFDTEFISEKRFYPMLCLIQVITEQGVYILDTVTLKQLDPFLRLIENPNILKITHAGENDYRLLNALYGTLPKNLFDTQIAMGFLSHTYPMSFQNMVEKELQVTLDKSFSVTDWEARPITRQQLNYALNDVLYLPQLHLVPRRSGQAGNAPVLRNRYASAFGQKHAQYESESAGADFFGAAAGMAARRGEAPQRDQGNGAA
jgi:ribonuclease D